MAGSPNNPPQIKLTFVDSFSKLLTDEDVFSKKLEIPRTYVEEYGDALNNDLTLRNLKNRSWQILVKKSNNGSLYFERGWSEFVQDNSLQVGDLLFFLPTDESTFYVVTHDKNGVFKKSTPEVNCKYCKCSCKSTGGQSRKPHVTPSSSRSTKGMGIQEDSSHTNVEPAKKYPSFRVKMQDSYVRSYLPMPSQFLKKVMHVKEKITAVKLRVSRKEWDVTLKIMPRDNRLTEGWRAFSRANCLQLGDICVFELINRKDYLFKVSIFRLSSF